jgi:hypothetical protein
LRPAEEAGDGKGIERDADIQNKLLSMLYVKRRENVSDPGISDLEVERFLACRAARLQFHIWYLKEKGSIGTEKGMLATTIEAIDRAHSERPRKIINEKLLRDQSRRG